MSPLDVGYPIVAGLTSSSWTAPQWQVAVALWDMLQLFFSQMEELYAELFAVIEDFVVAMPSLSGAVDLLSQAALQSG